jgi:hypothetical protein
MENALWLIGIALLIRAITHIFGLIHTVVDTAKRNAQSDALIATQQILAEAQADLVVGTNEGHDINLRHARASEALARAAGGTIEPELGVAQVHELGSEKPDAG